MGLGSGYHRDLQQTKKAFVEACEICVSTLKLLLEAVPQLQVHEETSRPKRCQDPARGALSAPHQQHVHSVV